MCVGMDAAQSDCRVISLISICCPFFTLYANVPWLVLLACLWGLWYNELLM